MNAEHSDRCALTESIQGKSSGVPRAVLKVCPPHSFSPSIESLPRLQLGLFGTALLFRVQGFVRVQCGDEVRQLGRVAIRSGLRARFGLGVAFSPVR